MSTSASPDVSKSPSESDTVVPVGALCGSDCEQLDGQKNPAIGLLIGGAITLLILACVVLYVYLSVKRKTKTPQSIENGENKEILQNWANSMKRKVKGITNPAYVDHEMSRPVTSRESSVPDSLDIATAITLYCEDKSDVCVWGLATPDIAASTVTQSSALPVCIHNGILPTPAPPIVDGHVTVDRAVRPSSIDVRATVPDQSDSVLVDDVMPPVGGVLCMDFNDTEPAVDEDTVEGDNRDTIDICVYENDHATGESTEELAVERVGASENDSAATEERSSEYQVGLCNDDSDTSGIHSADRSDTDDAAKTPPNACAAAASDAQVHATPVTPCAGTAGNDADDELSDIDDVDLTGVVVNSSFDSTDNILDVNDVIVDREARQITIGSLSLNFNVDGPSVQCSPEDNINTGPATTQGDAATQS